MPILEVIVLGETLTAEAIGQTLYAQTAAELAASVTPVAYRYPPGDIRRYGAVSDGSADCSAALDSAIKQACQPGSHGSASVYIPGASQGWKMLTGVSAPTGFPFRMYGDTGYYSALYTTADITLLTLTDVQQYQGVHIQDVCFLKTSGTPTKAGVHFKNSAYCRMSGCLVQGFLYQVRFEPTVTAPSSCFSCSLEDCTLVGAIGTGAFNIRAEANTNHLHMRNVTFGGTGGGGLYMIDSGGLCIQGGDCESVSGAVAIDIDCTSELRPAVLIESVDFEGCACSAGVIRIGNTELVRNVNIISNVFVNGAASEYLINPVRCAQLTVFGNAVTTGTNSGFHINPTSTTRGDFRIFNNTWQIDYLALTYSANMTPSAAVAVVSQTVTITDASAFTLNAPEGAATAGQRLSLWFINTSGGAHGTGTISAYKGAGAFPAIATGTRRMFTFEYNGTSWFESYRSPNDVSN